MAYDKLNPGKAFIWRIVHRGNLEWVLHNGLHSANSGVQNGTYKTMINFTKGNLLDSDTEALVNTVNTVGVMGKGIALMFKERFKDNYEEYRSACASNQLQPGSLFITKPSTLIGPKWIINFATKKHWKGKSKIEWIESGLRELRDFIEKV